MGDPLKKVRDGERMKFPAAAFNSFVDSANANKFSGRSGAAPVESVRSTAVFPVRNDTGADLARFAIVALDSPVVSPDDSPDGFTNGLVLKGITPDSEQHAGRWGVCFEPIASGKIGRVVVDGLTWARIDGDSSLDDHHRVDAGNDSAALIPNDSGSGIVIWREGGTDEQWAIVRICSPGGGGSSFKSYQIIEEKGDFLLCHPYDIEAEEADDETTIAIAKPRLLQQTPFDGQTITFPDKDVLYTYSVTPGLRTAETTDDADATTTEAHRIVPAYFIGDILTAFKGATGLAHTPEGEEEEEDIVWTDLNNGSRVWAHSVSDDPAEEIDGA